MLSIAIYDHVFGLRVDFEVQFAECLLIWVGTSFIIFQL